MLINNPLSLILRITVLFFISFPYAMGNIASFSDSQGNVNVATSGIYQFDTIDIMSPNISLEANSRIVINRAGYYQISYSLNWRTPNNNRRQIRTQLRKNGSELIASSISYGYARRQGQAAKASNRAISYVQLIPSDYIELTYENSSTVTGEALTLPGEVTISIEYIEPVAGDLSFSGDLTAWGTNGSAFDFQGKKVIHNVVGAEHCAFTPNRCLFVIYNDGRVEHFGGESLASIHPNLSTMLDDLEGLNVKQISSSTTHVLALTKEGEVLAWGLNNIFGQADVPTGLSKVVQIAAGDSGFSIALLEDGTVESWGYDFSGHTQMPQGLTNIQAISAGTAFVLALTTDGKVIGWGENNSARPLDIPSDLNNVKQISAGKRFGIALRNDGTVVGWGRDVETINFETDLSNVVQVVSGASIAALKSNGSLVLPVVRGIEYQALSKYVGNIKKIVDIEGALAVLQNP